MGTPRFSTRALWDHLRAPRVDQARLERQLRRVMRALPTPVFWLLGKAQSGKTSLIRALTGDTRAEIGDGFRPCTRRSQLYPPGEDTVLRFLDTRGLGEIDYDPAEDIRLFERQAHCLVVVVKAMDHALQGLLAPLREIHRAHREWPIIVVQSCLHEGYPPGARRHPMPYPYRRGEIPPGAPGDLARSLVVQRRMFEPCRARFVPVDLTLPEDAWSPESYGLDELWEAIDEAVPLGLRAMLREDRDSRRTLGDVYLRSAHPHILYSSALAGAAGLIPLPLADIPLFLAIQAKLFHTLASIYGQRLTAQSMAEILGTLGLGAAMRLGWLGAREALKVVPWLGAPLCAGFCAASTYALGRSLCAYFAGARRGAVPDASALRGFYREQYVEGQRRLGRYLGGMNPRAGRGAP